MKAEDTMLTDKELMIILEQHGYTSEKMAIVRKAQAKTSFNAGIREVVEWVMSHQDGMFAGQDIQDVAGNDCKYGNTSHLLVRWLDWQSKLKEWGI